MDKTFKFKLNRDRVTVYHVLCSIVSLAIVFLAFLTFYYYDFSDTLDNAVLLAKSIFHHDIDHYYEYAALNKAPGTKYSANYNIFLYGIFMVWNLPTIIAHKANGLDYMSSSIALLWCKSLILLANFGIVFVLNKIFKLYVKNDDDRIIGNRMFLVNCCTLLGSMIACQYDNLSIFLMLLGIYFYLKNKDLGFYLSFLFAIPLKSFAIFIFIPLLLLKEKNIIKIGIKTAFVCLFQIALGLPFRNEPYYKLALDSQNRDAMNLLLESRISIVHVSINLFAVSLLAVCVFAYMHKEKDDEKNPYVPLYYSFAAISTIVLFVFIRTYWIILIVPFSLLVALFNPSKRRVNLLIWTVASFSFTVKSLMSHWIYSIPEHTNILLLRKLELVPDPTVVKYGSIGAFFEYYDLFKYSDLFFSIFFCGIVLLLVLNFPTSKNIKIWKDDSQAEKIEWWIEPLQIAMALGIVMLIIFSNIKTTTPAIVSTSTERSGEYTLGITYSNSYELAFSPSEDSVIHSIAFYPRNAYTGRENRSTLSVTIIDKDTNEVLCENIIGVCIIENNKVYRISVDNIPVNAGGHYAVQFTPHNGDTSIVSLERTYSMPDDNTYCSVNGERMDSMFAIEIR